VAALVIRRCRREELHALEWQGAFRGDRALFRRVFARAEQGAMVMLVASRAGEHVGQIWIDLARARGGAVLWALRVQPRWRGAGIGTRLVAAAERIARHAGRRWVELEVEPHNARARALYERLGYRRIGRRRAVDAVTGARLDFELDVLRRPLCARARARGGRPRRGR
jgi:ribosomal-protein-alanine N-acetyltransferase